MFSRSYTSSDFIILNSSVCLVVGRQSNFNKVAHEICSHWTVFSSNHVTDFLWRILNQPTGQYCWLRRLQTERFLFLLQPTSLSTWELQSDVMRATPFDDAFNGNAKTSNTGQPGAGTSKSGGISADLFWSMETCLAWGAPWTLKMRRKNYFKWVRFGRREHYCAVDARRRRTGSTLESKQE